LDDLNPFRHKTEEVIVTANRVTLITIADHMFDPGDVFASGGVGSDLYHELTMSNEERLWRSLDPEVVAQKTMSTSLR
jgi:hypothetical protein